MTRRPSSKARLALLGDIFMLLRQRRRPVRSVVIHPDGTIEVRLGPPAEIDAQEPDYVGQIQRWLDENGD